MSSASCSLLVGGSGCITTLISLFGNTAENETNSPRKDLFVVRLSWFLMLPLYSEFRTNIFGILFSRNPPQTALLTISRTQPCKSEYLRILSRSTKNLNYLKYTRFIFCSIQTLFVIAPWVFKNLPAKSFSSHDKNEIMP